MFVYLCVCSCVLAIFRIWEYLVELVSTTRTTIVITTHYIEEARQANWVSSNASLYPSKGFAYEDIQMRYFL